MYEPRTPQFQDQPLTPSELLDSTFKLYRGAFRPLAITAGIGALLSRLLALAYAPESNAFFFLWSMVVLALSVVMQSAVLLLAVRAREDKPLTIAAAVAAVLAFGPRYFAATFLVTAVSAGLAITIIGIPLAAFVFVRCSLFGPAIVIENHNIVGALVRSWRLIEGRWWRTFGLQLLVGLMAAAPFAVSSLVLLAVEGMVANVALDVAASAVAIPLVACFSLLLFEDYRRLTGGATPPLSNADDTP